MARWILAAAVLAALLAPLPAAADAKVESLLVRRIEDRVNIRVTLKNPSPHRQPGPVVIDLFVRAGEGDTWQKIKTWKDIRYIQPGYRVSRDFFDTNSPLLHQLAETGQFEVKASVRAPGMAETVETTSWRK